MAKISELSHFGPLAQAIYQAYEQHAETELRPNLGPSVAGHECTRHLWYAFHWAQIRTFEGRILRLLDTGRREEARIVSEIQHLPPFQVREMQGESVIAPHVAGSIDGEILYEGEWRLLEVKTHNGKRFAELQSKGVAASNPEHVVQMQLYMRGRQVRSALYLAVCKDTDSIYEEVVDYDETAAEAHAFRATQVVEYVSPPPRIGDSTYWKCRFCSFNATCQGADYGLLERNCRTCVSATPMPDGTWQCAHWNSTLDQERQEAGCMDHLMIPGLLTGWTPFESCDERRFVMYRDDTTGEVWQDSQREFRRQDGE